MMKKLFLALAFFILLVTSCFAATWTAAAGGGNWNSNDTWEEGGGYPVAGDTAIFDSGSGNVTCAANSACAVLNMTGYTNTLTIGTKNLVVSGNATVAGYVLMGITSSTGWSIGGDLLLLSGGDVTCVNYSKIVCSGSLDFSAGTYHGASLAVITFNATSSGKTITSGSASFNKVYFNGVGAVWTLGDNFTATWSPVAFTAGTLILDGRAMTISRSQTVTIANGFTLVIGTGTLTTGSAVSTSTLSVADGGVVTISTGSIYYFGLNVAGTLTCSGAADIRTNYNIALGSGFTAGTSTIRQNVGGAATLSSVNPLYNFEIGNTVFSVATILASDIVIQNDLIFNYAASRTRDLYASTYTLTIGGNFTCNAVGCTFNADTGTVVFNNAAKISTITGTTTFNILQCLTQDKAVKFKAGQTFTVASFDFTGAASHLILIDTDTAAGTFTLSDSAGTNQVEYCDIHRSTATGVATWNAFTTDGNVDGGGNSGWIFTAPAAGGFSALMLSGD